MTLIRATTLVMADDDEDMPTCRTCVEGCDCRGHGTGCGHFGCWGPLATGSCPAVASMMADVYERVSVPACTARR